jgi:hypothetical protein
MRGDTVVDLMLAVAKKHLAEGGVVLLVTRTW